MSTASVKSMPPEPAYGHLVRLTVQACQVAKEAAGAAAEGIASGSPALLHSLRQREKERAQAREPPRGRFGRVGREPDRDAVDAVERAKVVRATAKTQCGELVPCRQARLRARFGVAGDENLGVAERERECVFGDDCGERVSWRESLRRVHGDSAVSRA